MRQKMGHDFPNPWIAGIGVAQQNNFSNASEPSPDALAQIHIIHIIELVVASIGLLGNIVCLVVLLHRSQRHLANTPYLISLATSDFLLVYFNTFTTRLKSVTGLNIPGPLGWCGVRFFMGYSCITISSLVMALFTLNRMLAAYVPSKNMTLMPIKRTIVILFFLWLSVLGLHVPYLLVYEPDGICVEVAGLSWVLSYYSPILRLSIMGFLPDVIILVGNLAIVFKIYHLKHARSGMSLKASPQDDRYNTAIVTCLWLGTFHVVTRAPLLSNIAYQEIATSPASDIYLVVSETFYLFAIFNHSVNFILYIVINPSFRKTLRNILCCQ